MNKIDYFKEIIRDVQQYLEENLIQRNSILKCVYSYDDEKIRCNSIKLKLEPTFTDILFSLIKDKKIQQIDVYKNSNIDRKLFSRMRNDKEYQPSKRTVFALIIGMRLTLPEANKLLKSAGYAFSHSIKLDVILECLVKRGEYDIHIVNDVLYSFNCPLLGER